MVPFMYARVQALSGRAQQPSRDDSQGDSANSGDAAGRMTDRRVL